MGIVYRRSSEMSDTNLEHTTPWGYCDTNYAEDPCDHKSTSGYVFMLTGGPATWKSKKQVSVVLSTTEVEYYGVGIACQETMWIKQLCQELNMSINEPIQIYTNNTGAVALTDNIMHCLGVVWTQSSGSGSEFRRPG